MTDGNSSHEALVTRQYGARADAYLTSAVHAEGEDLRRLEQIVRGARPAKALDLGCGAGHVSFRIAPYTGVVTAYDLTPSMAEVVTRAAAERGLPHIRTATGPAGRLPFGAATFAFVATRYSAHHWHDLPRGLAEARRVLKPDGHAVFMDSVTPGVPLLDTFLQSIELLRDTSHVRNLSCAEWDAALARAGFRVTNTVTGRIRLDFTSWVTRMRTPELHVAAIRSLQQSASGEVKRHFALEEDGSFMLDTALFEAVPE
jgi:ubiquinone/menaquinone biosynthesis C-methylase UbiE